jgi:pSer/pThr/pTyr-binding forkhead associated (FHA) protein
MPTCPKGHTSTDEDYCDVCGLALNGSAPPAAAPAPEAEPAATTLCPACDAPLAGRFCENCGHDSLAAPPPRPQSIPEPQAVLEAPAEPRIRTWTATVSADRDYFNSVMAIGGPDADSISFPPFCPERFFPLHGKEITIGRRSTSRGINPDIDLTGPPEDPGVSHLHAVFLTQPDGGLSIVDLNSANGTTLNDNQNVLPANTPAPLSNGDRIHLGAWTTITVRVDS